MKTSEILFFDQVIESAQRAVDDKLCRCGRPMVIFLFVAPPTKTVNGQILLPLEIGCEKVFQVRERRYGPGIFTNFNLSDWLSKTYFRLIKTHRHTRTETVAWYRERPKTSRVFQP
jgi:hypothetical protein